ncbi:putative cyclin-B3-1 isoform X2 [Prosopis cineraria]|uniref:putative cyclin-B3-1 isoform X2 n=1 Tax=Prosopis cineraria TaxID=364024 RepID=UPI00240FFCD2|nr:putative cyclin-B3-1 isoform X2 [Prosopis cineraria]
MAAVKLQGKSKVGLTRVFEDGQSRKNSGARNFKVLPENEQLKIDDDGLAKPATGASEHARRSALVANKGVVMNTASNSKVGLKSMKKSSGIYGSSANMKARKALADVSNVQGNSMRNIKQDASKMKVLASTGTKLGDASSRKSFMGRLHRKIIQVDGQLEASKRVSTSSIPPLGAQKINKSGGRSSIATEGRTTRKSLLPSLTRRSLPVPRRVNREDMSNRKGNAGSSDTAKKISGISTKEETVRKVAPQLSGATSHLRKTRVSDGHVHINLGARVKTNVLYASSRKSTKPLVKRTLKASNAPRTSKSKSKSAAAISSQDEEAVALSLPDNNLPVVSNDAYEGQLPSGGDSNPRTSSLEIIGRKKSTRRKSYTTLLMERSKLLKESGEMTEQDNLPNIDDECNQLEVSEYVDDIYQYYWVTEAQAPALMSYMSIQTDLTPHMRGILINWLIEVHLKYELMPETLYLTVSLLDQYLSLVAIEKNELQLVGLTALLLASKYEDFWHPSVKELLSISVESYTREQILGMEKLILRKLKFRLNGPTPYVFMVRFLKAAQSDKRLEHLAFFLIELCLVEYEALAFKSSLVCASAIYVARCTLQIAPPWTPLLHKHCRYEVSQLRNCAEMILKFHKSARAGNLMVTCEKYSRPELSRVATLKPLDNLPL